MTLVLMQSNVEPLGYHSWFSSDIRTLLTPVLHDRSSTFVETA